MLIAIPQPLEGILLRVLLTVLAFTPLLSAASSTLTPTLTLKEYLVSNTTSTLDETGQITIFSPGFRYENNQRRSQFNVDYSYNIERHNGLSSVDRENHSLSLLYGFTHIPEHWLTQVTGNVRQSTVSPDAIQSLSSGLFSDTKQLRTYGVSTLFNTQLKQSLNLKTRLLADFADYEDSANTESLGANLSLDNKVSRRKLYWNTDLSSRQSNSGTESESINTLLLGLNYRFNHQYTGYINTQFYDTSNSDLNDTATLAGLNWQPNTSSNINAGVGVRGNDTSYSLNTNFKKKRLSLSVNYNEDITSERSEVLQQTTDVDSGVTSTFQSLSITPILQKKADINVSYTGKRSDITLSYFVQKRSVPSSTSAEEKTSAISVSMRRQLSVKSSISVRLQKQKRETSVNNDVNDLQLSYSRFVSRNINLNAELTNSKQQSSRVENEYERNLIGISVLATF